MPLSAALPGALPVVQQWECEVWGAAWLKTNTWKNSDNYYFALSSKIACIFWPYIWYWTDFRELDPSPTQGTRPKSTVPAEGREGQPLMFMPHDLLSNQATAD